ncbi:RNA polymerase sigma factor [Carboxylicivirga mesophila]|uniref:RNA polymerase sigma factor n=1 Tax=Carboxylicivirga mesophila TaxID=1166478 RepID=A0ABS5KC14_9BACT|nr:RNA polymerase sigma factor [Carboxylicivirga mesophila]MBS2212574.1 RNA polymerase sigma factor [Carboxylicivirga mesophila]
MSKAINLTEQLVARCVRGDERASLALYKQYVKAMYNVAYRIVGNQFDAEDVIQDAFVKAFDKIGALKEPKAFGSWLKQMVINQSISLIRKQKRLKIKLHLNDELPEPEHDNVSPDLPIELVMKAVMELPEGARVVFTLRVIEGYKFSEIAQMTGLTENNCKVQFHRSRKLLNNQLKSNIYAE